MMVVYVFVSFIKKRSLGFDVNKQFGFSIKFLMLLFSTFVIDEVNVLHYKEITICLGLIFYFIRSFVKVLII